MVVKAKGVEIGLTEKEWDTLADCSDILSTTIHELKDYLDKDLLDDDQYRFYIKAKSTIEQLFYFMGAYGYENKFTVEE